MRLPTEIVNLITHDEYRDYFKTVVLSKLSKPIPVCKNCLFDVEKDLILDYAVSLGYYPYDTFK